MQNTITKIFNPQDRVKFNSNIKHIMSGTVIRRRKKDTKVIVKVDGLKSPRTYEAFMLELIEYPKQPPINNDHVAEGCKRFK